MASLAQEQSVVMPNRPHDYLYDYNFTVACRKDHVKQLLRSQAQQVVIHPSYDNMFSALRHFPAVSYSFKTHSVPPGLGQDRRNPSDGAGVVGSQRFKYFRRPIMPYLPTHLAHAGTIVYAKKHTNPVLRPAVERPATPPVKTVGVQTIYRESEAQTDPYSPEYILRPNLPPPELLALATLTYGAGLPAGMAELEMIERARIKRAWEATLPPVTDEASFEVRLKMMEEMELKEWKEREEEIKRLQEARLAVLVKVIEQREMENETANEERIERIWQRKLQERDALLAKTNRKRIKALRKLAEKRSKVEHKIERRDIISEYANYASKVYGPPARDGFAKEKVAGALNSINLHDVSDYNGLTELEKTFGKKVLELNMNTLMPLQDETASPRAKKEKQLLDQLGMMSKKIREQTASLGDLPRDTEPGRFAIKIEKPPQRPPTPSVQIPREEDEEMEVAAILLQKLIRGRIVQNVMYEGKERRLQLINELRTRHQIANAQRELQLSTSEGNAISADESATIGLTKQESDPAVGPGGKITTPASRNKATIKTGTQDEQDVPPELKDPVEMSFEAGIHSEYVGKMLDYYTKELVRLREERRIAAMVRLAERTRRMREAEESGRRQVELKRRAQEDEVFKQVMSVHQETVDSFLEDIVVGAVSETASEEARAQVREYAQKIDVITEQLMKIESERPDEAAVSDLVSSFLIPHVEKEMTRHQVERDQQKYLMAAHRAIYGPIEELEGLTVEDKTSSETKEGVLEDLKSSSS